MRAAASGIDPGPPKVGGQLSFFDAKLESEHLGHLHCYLVQTSSVGVITVLYAKAQHATVTFLSCPRPTKSKYTSGIYGSSRNRRVKPAKSVNDTIKTGQSWILDL